MIMGTVNKIKKEIENKNILVTGGTGSFGHQIVCKLLTFNPKKIVIYSRDEKKQYDMQNEFEKFSSTLKYVIGDVRDYTRIYEAMKGIDIVYHAAALKQVPSCEFQPIEAIKTNVLGAENVRRSAVENGVKIVLAISTDKAVKPVNIMGMTKAIQERVMLGPDNEIYDTKFMCVRYGNVLGSRGSVIPFFKQRIKEGKFLPITDYEMTRFLLTLDDAVDLVFEATISDGNRKLFVKKAPASYVTDLAKCMAKAMTGKTDYKMKEVGIRPGEKIHETLVSEEEMHRVVETNKHYIIYPHGELKKPKLIRNLKEYCSNNTKILNENEISSLLKAEGWI